MLSYLTTTQSSILTVKQLLEINQFTDSYSKAELVLYRKLEEFRAKFAEPKLHTGSPRRLKLSVRIQCAV